MNTDGRHLGGPKRLVEKTSGGRIVFQIGALTDAGKCLGRVYVTKHRIAVLLKKESQRLRAKAE